MIPRYQRILFVVLLACSVIMGAVLYNHHRNNYKLRDDARNDTPIEAPSYAAAETATLALANDSDGSITATERQLALPTQPAVRARALLEHLLAEYTLPHSPHPIGGGIAVADVYLLDLPLASPSQQPTGSTFPKLDTSPELSTAEAADPLTHGTGQLAIVNLRGTWCDAHPSGITVETLTLQSILGTLHANMPQITKVRFLVDGQPRPTLAGNVELDRTYDAVDTTNVVTPTHD